MKNKIFILSMICTLLFSCSKSDHACVAVPIKDCAHTEEFNPVCGCDGKTYENPGAAACNSITEFVSGPCPIDLSELQHKWKFLGYASDGAKIGKNAKFHPYDITINFSSQADNFNFVLDGKSSVNQFIGLYASPNIPSINLTAQLSTKIAGTIEALEYEESYIRNLNLSNNFKIEDDFLELSRNSIDFTKLSPMIFKKG